MRCEERSSEECNECWTLLEEADSLLKASDERLRISEDESRKRDEQHAEEVRRTAEEAVATATRPLLAKIAGLETTAASTDRVLIEYAEARVIAERRLNRWRIGGPIAALVAFLVGCLTVTVLGGVQPFPPGAPQPAP
jgi:hypothetical protein